MLTNRVPNAKSLSILIAIMVSSFCNAQTSDTEIAGNQWTPEFSMQFNRLQGTAISADASQIAYILNKAIMDDDKSEYLSQLWVVSADGTRNRQYTQSEYSATAPAFSPDGQFLTFLSKRGEAKDDKTQIWLMPLFGGEARQLTAAENNVESYKWSPRGDRIAFTMTDPLSKERQQEIDEKRDVILVDQQPLYRHLHVVNVDPSDYSAKTPVKITNGNMVVGGFDWSPTGSAIAFAHKPDPDINVANLHGDISRVNVPSTAQIENMISNASAGEAASDDSEQSLQIIGEVTALVSTAGVENSPHWSPDGNWIAYSSSGVQPELISRSDVYVIPASGGDSRRLAITPNQNANINAWANDSSELYLTESMGTRRAVIGLPLRGESYRLVTAHNAGAVANVSVASGQNKLVYSWETPDSPWDLYLRSTDNGGDPLRLTTLHRDIDLPEMGRTELLRWIAEDGMEIEGLLTYPIGYEAGNSFPIILNVHGGPSGVYSENFTGGPSTYMTQVFAQNGYAILRPNPRGSTGYGFDFREATARDWGYGDLQDLLTGLDLVIDQGIGDVDNQYLMGWSYGGYITAFAVTQTDRFKAASMGAGISNLVSMSTTTDIRDYLVEHMGGYFWDVLPAYQRSSAINHIANVVTPTQVIHGQEDKRVPFNQGQEFYNALKYRGIDTEMVVYPRTPHGPREPKFLMDVSSRILSWFDKYRSI